MGIEVLGPLAVNGQSSVLAPRDRVVLEALALRPGEVVTAERLADALWTDTPPATWSKVLQGSVVRLRKMLGTDAIETVDHGYRLVVHAGDVDALEFQRLVARARELLLLDEAQRASYTVGEALALWRGSPLADLENWEPGRLEASRLEELRNDAEELRLDAELRIGHHREVLGEAQRRVEEAPMRERRWELLALAQYRAGRQADALRTLRQVKTVLVNELGLDPSPDLVALEQAILRHDPFLLVETALPEPSAMCPYLGLVRYDVADAEGFFGRDADIAACLGRLADTGVLAVVGPSGSGKSSLVRAGLAAALRRDGRRVVVVSPGAHPMDSLTALPSTGRPVVLVVDQCEEAISLCEDPDEQARFFAALSAHAERGPMVVALRGDRLGDLAAHSDFARLVERGLYLLNPMSSQDLRAAIEGPARQAGLRLEPGLVDLLVREVEEQPGALPQLSHALRETWERREGSVLTLEGYRATGGIRNAVAQSAEDLYESMSAEQRAMLRDLMLRLVTSGPEGEPVRSRIPRRLLTVDPEHDRLMEQLVAARLVTSDEGVVELAHLALARAWPRLRGWLDEDTEGQRILRHLAVAADTWDAMGRPESELYRGNRLAQALDWRADAKPDLTPTERSFLDAARRLADSEEQTAAQQARHQARVNRRLRELLVGVALLLVVAVVAGTLAVREASRANEARTVADARRVTAQSQLTDRVDRSLQLAVAAHELEPSAEARAGLLAALARSPQLMSFVQADGQPFWHLDVSRDGRTLAVVDHGNQVHIYDTHDMSLKGTYDPFPKEWDQAVDGSSEPVAVSPGGETVALATLNLRGRVIRLVDTETFRPRASQPGGFPPNTYPNDVGYSPDGQFLAVTFNYLTDDRPDASVYVWDLKSPARPLHKTTLDGDTQYVEFAPDGERMYVAPRWTSRDPSVVQVFEVSTGKPVADLDEVGYPFDIRPDSSAIAFTEGTDVVLADPLTGRTLRRFKGPQDEIRQVRFSAGGELLVAVAEDRSATVWDTRSGETRERIPIGAGLSADVRFSADSQQLFAAVDSGLLVFDLRGDQRYVRQVTGRDALQYPSGWYTSFTSPDAAAFAVSIWDPRIQDSRLYVFDAATGERTPVEGLAWAGDGDGLAWSPGGRRLAVLERRGRLRVREWRTGEVVAERRFRSGGGLQYSGDGTRLLVHVADDVVLLDARTLETLTEPLSVPGRNTALAAFGPGDDTAVLVTATELGGDYDLFGAARQWSLVDLDSGEVVREGQLEHSATSVALSPYGERLAVASADGVEIVDLGTGETRTSVDVGAESETEGLHLTYSGDGMLLASTDTTGRVSLWDGQSGALLGTVKPGSSGASVVFLADHKTLLISSSDGSVYEWDTSVEHAVGFACNVVGRSLSKGEWRAAFGDRGYRETC